MMKDRAQQFFEVPHLMLLLVFFAGMLFLVMGWPQYWEEIARRAERAADHKVQRPGGWQRFREDLKQFYIPVWRRMAAFMLVTLILVLVVGRY